MRAVPLLGLHHAHDMELGAVLDEGLHVLIVVRAI